MNQKPICTTNKEIVIRGFRGGSNLPYPDFVLPVGLRCKPINEGSTKGKFFLTDLPTNIFPRGSCLRHDADHYGVVIENEDVDVFTPVPPDYESGKEITSAAILAERSEKAENLEFAFARARRSGIEVVLHYHIVLTLFTVTANGKTVYRGDDPDAAIEAYATEGKATSPAEEKRETKKESTKDGE